MSAIASRVGRKPVTIPSGVDVKYLNNELTIKGPKGHISVEIPVFIDLDLNDNQIKIKHSNKKSHSRKGSEKKSLKSAPGTTRSNIQNAVLGVAKGFERKLILVGVGYRAQVKGKLLNLTLGYSHAIDFPIPEGITIETPSVTEVIIKGIDKHLVGHTASIIRGFRSPEPYKGKGIRYANENVARKETKKK